MKATIILKTVAIAVTMLIGSIAYGFNKNDYYSNLVMNNGVAQSKIIYEMQTGLVPNKKYDISYDENNRISEIVLFKWDSAKKEWKNIQTAIYSYANGNVKMEKVQ